MPLCIGVFFILKAVRVYQNGEKLHTDGDTSNGLASGETYQTLRTDAMDSEKADAYLPDYGSGL